MNQRHKHADVIIAWAEGEDVQVWDEGTKRWYNIVGKFPLFNEDREHRIKPPAKKYRVALFRKYKDDELLVAAANSQVTADDYETMPDFVRWLTDWVEYEE